MRLLSKLTLAEQRRLDRLRATAERRVQRAIDNFVRVITTDAALRVILRLLEVGDTEGILRMVDEQIVVAGDTLSDVFIDAGADLTVEVAEQINNDLPEPPLVGVSFDPTHPDAVALMRKNKLEFVREMSDKQRRAIRAALADALLTGAGPIDAARAIRDAIGLTERQRQMVENYRRLLTEGSLEALDRDLRDRRFDRTVERASNTQIPLTNEQINRMVERYRQRFLTYRAEVIARTETTRILSQARHHALRQAMEQAGIRDNQVIRVWGTTLDSRERWTHHEMDAQEVVGLESYFQSPSGAMIKYPGDPDAPAEEIIQCRCVLSFRFNMR